MARFELVFVFHLDQAFFTVLLPQNSSEQRYRDCYQFLHDIMPHWSRLKCHTVIESLLQESSPVIQGDTMWMGRISRPLRGPKPLAQLAALKNQFDAVMAD